MSTLHGKCDARFDEVRKLVQQSLDTGKELGVSLTVSVDGEEVINLWGGHADKNGSPWDEHTIVPIMSSSKCVAALALLKVIDEGIVSADDHVSKHWPEFAQNGKETALVRHLMSHSVGLPAMLEPVTMEQVCQDPGSTAPLLARQKPLWTPGTEVGYHGPTFGPLLSEVVCRATGKSSFLDFLADRAITAPGGSDFYLGVPEAEFGRIALVYSAEGQETEGPDAPDDAPEYVKAAARNPRFLSTTFETDTFRKGINPSYCAHANAASLNRIFTPAIMSGKPGGLMSQETMESVFVNHIQGHDPLTQYYFRLGLGFGLPGLVNDEPHLFRGWVPKGRLAYWGGWGGSLILLDMDRRMVMTYAMNSLRYDTESGMGTKELEEYSRAVYRALGVSL